MGSIMVQGTTSSAGKSIICTGLCRIFMNDGIKVHPFKAQNMSTKSYLTEDGKLIAVAQALQAIAAGIKPHEDSNPILLIPDSDNSSKVILNGVDTGEMASAEYFTSKPKLKEMVRKKYKNLEERFDLIVIEGAGSPAEINLNKDDIVNMGMAEIADSKVILVTDIDRGGSFAALYGTVMLLEPKDRSRIKGFVFNKFRGDRDLLQPGIEMIEELTGIPVVGVVPYLKINLRDEDSLTDGVKDCESGLQNYEEQEKEIEKLAEVLRTSLNMEIIYELAGI